jgi:hypothetical protein
MRSWTWPLPPELTKAVIAAVKRNSRSQSVDYASVRSAALVCKMWRVSRDLAHFAAMTDLVLYRMLRKWSSYSG